MMFDFLKVKQNKADKKQKSEDFRKSGDIATQIGDIGDQLETPEAERQRQAFLHQLGLAQIPEIIGEAQLGKAQQGFDFLRGQLAAPASGQGLPQYQRAAMEGLARQAAAASGRGPLASLQASRAVAGQDVALAAQEAAQRQAAQDTARGMLGTAIGGQSALSGSEAGIGAGLLGSGQQGLYNIGPGLDLLRAKLLGNAANIYTGNAADVANMLGTSSDFGMHMLGAGLSGAGGLASTIAQGGGRSSPDRVPGADIVTGGVYGAGRA